VLVSRAETTVEVQTVIYHVRINNVHESRDCDWPWTITQVWCISKDDIILGVVEVRSRRTPTVWRSHVVVVVDVSTLPRVLCVSVRRALLETLVKVHTAICFTQS